MTLKDTLATGRTLTLDGAMGSLLQGYGLTEADFRGTRFAASDRQLRGNNDVLTLTRPDIVADVHRRYLEAGADIVCTDTFSAQRVSQQEYMLSGSVAEMNREAVRLAREAVAACAKGREHFVVGDVGPTSRMLSMSDDVSDPAARSITFAELCAAYREQIDVLVAEGVDGVLIETVFDTLNAKAALAAFADSGARERGVALLVSMTISDASGRTLSGQSVEAFVTSVMHARPDALGMNCGLGAQAMVPYLRRMKAAVEREATWPVSLMCHPNAGLPNQFGEYDESPEHFARQMAAMLQEGLVSVAGGCCGTTPEHIAALVRTQHGASITRETPNSPTPSIHLSGLDAFAYAPHEFITVGERCNVAGSRKFLRLINEKKYDEALDIARTQVERGAQVVDVNMDDGLLDARREMTVFLNMLMSDPAVSRVPVMVDSSRFDVIEAGLQCCQGKCIVNSLSLKQGEEVFIREARAVRRMGAAVIVMLFDERGQATDYRRRIEIARRAYGILTDKVGFPATDIIFDPNVLTVATGIDEHRAYAADFIRATRWITENLPGARVSGGLSNLSFAFRGNNALREAMHAVFLHHAREAGMNMAIRNAATAVGYEAIDPELRERLTDVILNTRADATERLMEIAASVATPAKRADTSAAINAHSTTALAPSPAARLQQALLEGRDSTLAADIDTLLQEGKAPLDIIAGPLMEGMNRVGKLFGEGRMFLPQVVRTARTMKRAVDILQPLIENDSPAATNSRPRATGEARRQHTAGTVVIATVKGDVHDIGKNIVGVVLACNGFRVIDLGVMVPAERIVSEAKRAGADIVCLSGLITPSLDEMCRVAEAMQREGMTVPLFVGGATTSEAHTAVKLAPLYAGPVFHMRDASQDPVTAMRLLDPAQHDDTVLANRSRQQRVRLAHTRREQRMAVERATSRALGEPQAAERRFLPDWQAYTPPLPPYAGQGEVRHIAVSDLIALIDWTYFYWAWRVHEASDEARLLRHDAAAVLARLTKSADYNVPVAQAFYPARGLSDRITTGMVDIATPRQPLVAANGHRRQQCLALCDYVAPTGRDYIGLYAATVAPRFVSELEAMKRDGRDDYETILWQTLGDRLAEAAAEYLSRELARGYTSAIDGQRHEWHGIRPAVGYPSLPDQRLIFQMARLIDYPSLGITLTENGAMYPQASVTGLYLSHPAATYFSM